MSEQRSPIWRDPVLAVWILHGVELIRRGATLPFGRSGAGSLLGSAMEGEQVVAGEQVRLLGGGGIPRGGPGGWRAGRNERRWVR